MRWVIGPLAVLGLGCVAGGYVLFTADPAALPAALTERPQNAQIAAFGLIFLAIVFERAAVVLSFLHSLRRPHAGWSLAFVSLCLLIALDSLFFALRVRDLLPVRWTLFQLPPEEVTPPLEVLLLSPIAFAYAAYLTWPTMWRASLRTRAFLARRVQRAGSAISETNVSRITGMGRRSPAR
jgi:hypothetical protein